MEHVSLRRTLNRGLFHVFAGSIPAIALLFLPQVWVLIGLAAAVIVFLPFEVARLRIPKLNRWFYTSLAPLLRKEEQNKFTGSSYLLLGYLITTLVFPANIAILAILFASLGDPAATMVGTLKGHVRLWHKSVEGTAACLFICAGTAITVFIALSNPSLSVAIVGAIVATLFELLPLKLNDNLTISIGSAAAMMAMVMLT